MSSCGDEFHWYMKQDISSAYGESISTVVYLWQRQAMTAKRYCEKILYVEEDEITLMKQLCHASRR